ncbi:MAG: hypothetical protein P8181_00495 [bacterium]
MTGNGGSGKSRAMLDGGLAFFGAVTASVSHELNNVISIVNQTAGLLQDMIAADEKGIPINISRLATAVGTIQAQTGRGLGIIGRLNRFAHSADEASVEFDAGEVLGNLVELCRRLAGLKYAKLELECPAGGIRMTGNPFLVQAAVFLAIRAALGAVERDDTIRVSAQTEGGGVLARVECPRRIDAADPDMAALRSIVEYLNAVVDVRYEGGSVVVEMVFAGGGPGRSA